MSKKRRIGFWEGWALAYWPVALVVLMATGAEGESVARAVLWLWVLWMVAGWPIKRVVALRK